MLGSPGIGSLTPRSTVSFSQSFSAKACCRPRPGGHSGNRALEVAVVQSPRRVWLSATPWTAARQASLPITNSGRSLKLMSFALVMPSSHLILRRPLLLLPSIFPSIGSFPEVAVRLQVKKSSGTGSPVIRTPRFLQGAWVQSLVGELRPHVPSGRVKKLQEKKKKKEKSSNEAQRKNRTQALLWKTLQ